MVARTVAVSSESVWLTSQLKVASLLVKMDFDSVFGHTREVALHCIRRHWGLQFQVSLYCVQLLRARLP
jgi:hypothetical protein